MRRVLLLSFAVALAGCPPRAQYPECKVDEDCADHGQVCGAGFCRECREDANCAAHPERPLCRDALCVARAGCARDEDCAAGQKCAAGKCAPECAQESAARDCGQGRKCIGGRCAAEEECLADADCADGRACVDKVCSAQGRAAPGEGARRDCELKAVPFGFDDAALSAEARRQLDEDFQCLQKAPFGRAVIAGHTDERGTTEYNLALGERRAQAVKKYLTGLGLEAGRLKAISYGKERPADPGHDETAWARNRRAEITTEQ